MKLILCNCPPSESKTLASLLVERRLAACVNISAPVQSLYFWEGAICEEEECTLIIKADADSVPLLVTTLRDAHPYDVPEIIVFDVDTSLSDDDYVAWVRASCRPDN